MRWKIYRGRYAPYKKLPAKVQLIGIYTADIQDIGKYMGIFPVEDDEDIYAVGITEWRSTYIIAYKRDLLGE